MFHPLLIAAIILLGLGLLFAILGRIYASIRGRLRKRINEKFSKREILGATTRANFFGIKSKAGAQVRGNGALVLTRNALFFIRAVPHKEFEIPLASIRKVSMPRFFNGKLALLPLLCVHFDTEYGEDSMAWSVPEAKVWKNAIEKRIS